MRLLLDTSAVLAVLFGSVAIGARGEAAIIDPSNSVFVSATSAYELEVKKKVGKIDFPDVPDWEAALVSRNYLIAPITTAMFVAAARLQLHHKDPWDRLLIAQALADDLTIVTRDRFFAAYGVRTLW